MVLTAAPDRVLELTTVLQELVAAGLLSRENANILGGNNPCSTPWCISPVSNPVMREGREKP